MSDASILDKNICLVLNSQWLPIAQLSPKRAIISMCSESNGQKAAMGMDMVTTLDADGNMTLEYSTPTAWGDWLLLPVRPGDLSVRSAHQEIRVPTVIICGYAKMPMHKPRVSQSSIYARDGGRCQYTNQPVSRASATLDHIMPRSRGGKDDWQNLVLCHKDVNMAKADRTPEEAGLRLIKQPKSPPILPASAMITEPQHSSWIPFILKRNA